jgi:predicted transcriptional regulator
VAKKGTPAFSRREREIMEILYRLGEGSVAEVLGLTANAASYDAVRLTLNVLEEKGHVSHRREGRRYVYRPTVPMTAAWRSAFQQLTRTFFRGSPQQAVLAMLDAAGQRMSDRELDEIAERIRRAKEEQS